MNDLEKARKELEIQRAETAKMELNYKIMKAMEEVNRIKDHIKLQDETIKRLKEELNG